MYVAGLSLPSSIVYLSVILDIFRRIYYFTSQKIAEEILRNPRTCATGGHARRRILRSRGMTYLKHGSRFSQTVEHVIDVDGYMAMAINKNRSVFHYYSMYRVYQR